MNQADRPKCKVVLRTYEGRSLARVHPKGCRINKKVAQPNAPIRRVDKMGRLKPEKLKVKVTQKEFKVHVKVGNSHEAFIYDTGATSTALNLRVARQLGLINSNNKPTGAYPHKNTRVGLADGSSIPTIVFNDVPLKLRETGVTTRGEVTVDRGSSLLYGVSHMKGQRKYLKVKFK